MAFTVGAIAAKDGAGTTVTGGLLALDQTGSGPWVLVHSLVDGVAGVNRVAVDGSNQLKVALADGALVTLGAKADAKSSATDVTAITLMQVAKQISASVQALVVALGSTAFDLGANTGGSRTLRVAMDTSQTEGSEYEPVAASQTNQAIGASGAAGDYMSHVVISPQTAGCGVVTVLDDTTEVMSFVGGGTTPLPSVAPFTVGIGMTSIHGAWKITTGANVKCTPVGNFT